MAEVVTASFFPICRKDDYVKACGVIVEYNPFHQGHMYHLKKSREKSQCDCIIGVMSGNWLQRGEPAFLTKWQRSEAALKNGCDLLIELPPHDAVQSADFFSRGGIRLLNDLGVSSLAFGTDAKEDLDYFLLGEQLVEKDTEIKNELFSLRHSGWSFPNQMKVVYEKLGIDGKFNQETPNHLLGITYAKEIVRQNPNIQLIPIKRMGQGYHEIGATNSFASASGIRKMVENQEFAMIEKQVPPETWQALKKGVVTTWEDYFPYYRYIMTQSTPESLRKIYQVEEGIENHLIKGDFSSYKNYLESIKTKRYSYSRLKRVMSYILLNFTQEEIQNQKEYLRVLGFNEVGQKYLNQMKNKLSFPLITRQTKEHHQLLAVHNRVDAIYQLKSGIKEQIQGRFPIRV